MIRLVYHDHPVAITAKRSLRLAVQDAALSRLKHEFDSRRERQFKVLLSRDLKWYAGDTLADRYRGIFR